MGGGGGCSQRLLSLNPTTVMVVLLLGLRLLLGCDKTRTSHNQIMGLLLVHFSVTMKVFIDHYIILFFCSSPAPYPLTISVFIILILVLLFKFQLFFQVSTLLITLVHHLFVTGELDAPLIFYLLFLLLSISFLL